MSSRSSPVLNLHASSRKISSVCFKWLAAAFALLDCIWDGCGNSTAWGFSNPVHLKFGFPPTQASFPQHPSMRSPMVGFFASILAEAGCGSLPPGAPCGLFPGPGGPELLPVGLQDGLFCLPPLPPLPPLPVMFEVLTMVCPAWGVFPVVGTFVALAF